MSDPARDQLPLTTVAFEILLAVAERERYGHEVMLAIDARTEGRISPNPGTLYRAIDRLVRKGLIEARMQPDEDGRSRKFFGVSKLGAEVLAAESERLAAQVSAAQGVAGERFDP